MPLPKYEYTADDYWAQPEGARVELVEGQLWALAAPSRAHQRIVATLTVRLTNHISEHQGTCEVYPAPFAVDLFADETCIVEPDISVICDHDKLTDRGCTGAPDFVVEVVSPSNPDMDYISKLHYYRDAGVREYWICDPERKVTRGYVFGEPSVTFEVPFAQPVASAVFPGFEITFGEVMAGM